MSSGDVDAVHALGAKIRKLRSVEEMTPLPGAVSFVSLHGMTLAAS